MSSSVFIPKEYAWDSAKGDWKSCITLDVDTNVGFDGEIHVEVTADITMLVPHPCGQPGVQIETTLQLYPSFKTGEPTKIEGFMFSGFHSSCQSVIRTLDMPADTEIY